MNNLSEEELEFIRKTKEKVENMNLFKQSNWTEEEKEYLLNSDKNFTEIAFISKANTLTDLHYTHGGRC